MESSGENTQRVETTRQAIHMLVVLLAFSLRWLSYPQALALAGALIFFNALILPRLPGGLRFLYRPEERRRAFPQGIMAYPASVFLLILLFPVPIAAAMWGALSFGDGPATLIGARPGRTKLPWNPKKSLEGTLAFILGATPAIAVLYTWTLPAMHSSPPWWRSDHAQAVFGSPGPGSIVVISLAVALACALLESLDTRIDDNLLAPLGGAVIMTALMHLLY